MKQFCDKGDATFRFNPFAFRPYCRQGRESVALRQQEPRRHGRHQRLPVVLPLQRPRPADSTRTPSPRPAAADDADAVDGSGGGSHSPAGLQGQREAAWVSARGEDHDPATAAAAAAAAAATEVVSSVSFSATDNVHRHHRTNPPTSPLFYQPQQSQELYYY